MGIICIYIYIYTYIYIYIYIMTYMVYRGMIACTHFPKVGISEFLRPDVGGFVGRFKERWQDALHRCEFYAHAECG